MDEQNTLVVSRELEGALNAGVGPAIARFALACLGGVPGVGGVFGAGARAWSDGEQVRFRKILAAWLKLQEDEIRKIGRGWLEAMRRRRHPSFCGVD